MLCIEYFILGNREIEQCCSQLCELYDLIHSFNDKIAFFFLQPYQYMACVNLTPTTLRAVNANK